MTAIDMLVVVTTLMVLKDVIDANLSLVKFFTGYHASILCVILRNQPYCVDRLEDYFDFEDLET
jgi:hypothetical protein